MIASSLRVLNVTNLFFIFFNPQIFCFASDSNVYPVIVQLTYINHRFVDV